MMHTVETSEETLLSDLQLEYLPLHPIPHSFSTEMVDNTHPLGRI